MVSIPSLAPSEISWMPDFFPPITPVVYRERLLEYSLLSIQVYPILSDKKNS